MATETLFAFTDIDHGMADGRSVYYKAGEQIDTKLFTVDELKSLVTAGAVSRFDRTLLETPEITVEDIDSLAASTSVPTPKP
jgi:hypothetical protein